MFNQLLVRGLPLFILLSDALVHGHALLCPNSACSIGISVPGETGVTVCPDTYIPSDDIDSLASGLPILKKFEPTLLDCMEAIYDPTTQWCSASYDQDGICTLFDNCGEIITILSSLTSQILDLPVANLSDPRFYSPGAVVGITGGWGQTSPRGPNCTNVPLHAFAATASSSSVIPSSTSSASTSISSPTTTVQGTKTTTTTSTAAGGASGHGGYGGSGGANGAGGVGSWGNSGGSGSSGGKGGSSSYTGPHSNSGIISSLPSGLLSFAAIGIMSFSIMLF
jgi:hypothetical protein